MLHSESDGGFGFAGFSRSGDGGFGEGKVMVGFLMARSLSRMWAEGRGRGRFWKHKFLGFAKKLVGNKKVEDKIRR